MNLYFTYESRDTLESLILFLNVKITSKLNVEHVEALNSEYKFKN